MPYDGAAIGRMICSLRKEHGLTQDVLSGLANISRSHLSMIENGTKCPNVDTLWRIAQALGMPLSAFFRQLEGEISQ